MNPRDQTLSYSSPRSPSATVAPSTKDPLVRDVVGREASHENMASATDNLLPIVKEQSAAISRIERMVIDLQKDMATVIREVLRKPPLSTPPRADTRDPPRSSQHVVDSRSSTVPSKRQISGSQDTARKRAWQNHRIRGTPDDSLSSQLTVPSSMAENSGVDTTAKEDLIQSTTSSRTLPHGSMSINEAKSQSHDLGGDTQGSQYMAMDVLRDSDHNPEQPMRAADLNPGDRAVDSVSSQRNAKKLDDVYGEEKIDSPMDTQEYLKRTAVDDPNATEYEPSERSLDPRDEPSSHEVAASVERLLTPANPGEVMRASRDRSSGIGDFLGGMDHEPSNATSNRPEIPSTNAGVASSIDLISTPVQSIEVAHGFTIDDEHASDRDFQSSEYSLSRQDLLDEPDSADVASSAGRLLKSANSTEKSGHLAKSSGRGGARAGAGRRRKHLSLGKLPTPEWEKDGWDPEAYKSRNKVATSTTPQQRQNIIRRGFSGPMRNTFSQFSTRVETPRKAGSARNPDSAKKRRDKDGVLLAANGKPDGRSLRRKAGDVAKQEQKGHTDVTDPTRSTDEMEVGDVVRVMNGHDEIMAKMFPERYRKAL